MNPITKAWRWLTLADHHTAASAEMLPAGHNAWISVYKEGGSESYSACCGDHLMLGFESFRETIRGKTNDQTR